MAAFALEVNKNVAPPLFCCCHTRTAGARFSTSSGTRRGSVQEIVGVEGGVAMLTLLNIAIKQSRDPDDFLFSI